MELWQTKKALVHRARHLIIGYRSPLLLQLGLLWILLLLRHPSTTFSTEWIPQNLLSYSDLTVSAQNTTLIHPPTTQKSL